MNRLEFLGKLRMVYCGDKNAFDDISKEQERLSIIEEKYKDCTQYYVNGFKEEINRLNNIINELEKYIHNELVLDFYNDGMPCELIINKMEKLFKRIKGE